MLSACKLLTSSRHVRDTGDKLCSSCTHVVRNPKSGYISIKYSYKISLSVNLCVKNTGVEHTCSYVMTGVRVPYIYRLKERCKQSASNFMFALEIDL